MTCSIPLPPTGIVDMTSLQIEIEVNQEKRTLGATNSTETKEPTLYRKDVEIELRGTTEYNMLVTKRLVLPKRNNIDKRVFAICIQRNAKVTVVAASGMDIEFYRTGTINNFKPTPPELNGNTKVWKWDYNGIILPKQGFIIIFKQ